MAVEARAMDIDYELPAVVKEITAEKICAYSGRHGDWHKKNTIHTNRQVAEEWGFPDLVCQGNMMLNYISEMLFKVYREHWIENSKVNVVFLKVVLPGEVLSAKGVVKEKGVANSATCLKLDVWVENKEGDKVIAGNAEVVID